MSGSRHLEGVDALLPALVPLRGPGSLGLALFDADLRLTAVNEAVADLHGLPPHAHEGRRLIDVSPVMGAIVEPLLRRVLQTGEPITDVELATSVPTRRQATYRALAAFHPLGADGRVTGVTALWWEVTDRSDRDRLLGDAERQFRSMADAAPVLIWLSADDGRCLWVNQRWTEWTGRTIADASGNGWLEAVHPDDRERARQAAGDALANATADQPHEAVYRFRRADGSYGWVLQRAVPRPTRSGMPTGLVGTCTDITELQELQRRVVDTHDRLERLQRLTNALAAATTTSDVVCAMLDHGITAVGAHAGIAVELDDDGTTLQLADARGYEPAVVEAMRRFPVDADLPLAAAVRTCRRVTYASAAEMLADLPGMPEHVPVTDDVAVVAMPLVTKAGVRGAFAVSFDRPTTFDPDELALLDTVAAQSAQAYERARLFDREARARARASQIATSLQRRLMPVTLPDVPGVDLGARYVPCGPGVEVGGDFYDAFAAPDGRWVLAIGDVRGRGVAAAAVTGTARVALRSAARSDSSPRHLLAHVNDILLQQERERPESPLLVPRFCTVGVVVLEPGDGEVRARVACAGHPLPLLVRPDGEVRPVGEPGMLLGVVEEPDVVERDVRLKPDEALVLLTDGILERRDGDRFFEDEVARVLAGCAGGAAEDIAACVESAGNAFGSAANDDDMAVLVARAAIDG